MRFLSKQWRKSWWGAGWGTALLMAARTLFSCRGTLWSSFTPEVSHLPQFINFLYCVCVCFLKSMIDDFSHYLLLWFGFVYIYIFLFLLSSPSALWNPKVHTNVLTCPVAAEAPRSLRASAAARWHCRTDSSLEGLSFLSKTVRDNRLMHQVSLRLDIWHSCGLFLLFI